jgi:hypothetical protein
MKLLILGYALALALQGKPSSSGKADIVAAGGCLKETAPGTWMLVDAGDPVVSANANAPTAKELAAILKSGKNQYQLTGVTVFDLSSHRGHSVVVKGLLNKAAPIGRLNMTALTMVSAECPAK